MELSQSLPDIGKPLLWLNIVKNDPAGNSRGEFQEAGMSQVIGTDVSFYDNSSSTPQGVDFVKMHSLAQFTIIRAGQNLWVDSDIKSNWSAAKQAGIPRGSYWFYDSRTDPKAQADLWVSALGGDFGELPMFLDLEETYGGPYAGWKNWVTFLERLKSNAPGKEIGLYTAYYYFRDYAPNASTDLKDLQYFRQYTLWIANYGANLTSPLVPQPWGANEWLFWQYTPQGDGSAYGSESDVIDLSYFNGTLDAFKARFPLPTPVPPPSPTLPPATPLKKKVAHGVNYVREVRQAPRPLMIHVLAIDLDISQATFLVTPASSSKPYYLCARTTSQFLKEFGVQFAINGDVFTYPNPPVNPCPQGRPAVQVAGYAASGGTIYSTNSARATFYVDRKNRITINARPWNVLQAVSGDCLLVANGKTVSGLDARQLNSRSALGITSNGRRMLMMVVDGSQPGYSEGVSLLELADLLVYFGMYTAMNLDGGGSSALLMQGSDKLPQVLNAPVANHTPGLESAVANHLGIYVR